MLYWTRATIKYFLRLAASVKFARRQNGEEISERACVEEIFSPDFSTDTCFFLYTRSEELQLHLRMARISQTINPGQNVR